MVFKYLQKNIRNVPLPVSETGLRGKWASTVIGSRSGGIFSKMISLLQFINIQHGDTQAFIGVFSAILISFDIIKGKLNFMGSSFC